MKKMEIYKCACCPALVEVVKVDEECDCVPECCGDPMVLLEAKTADAATEKHVPVIEKVDGGYKVTVGSVPHPMDDDHYIEWVELRADGKVYREYLKPGAPPEVVIPMSGDPCCALEHCNKHGLWRG